MRQDIYLFWMHQKEIEMYLIESISYVERPSAFWASSVLLSIGPMHWAHLMEGKRKCSCVVVVRRLDARHRPTQKERARSPGPTYRSANVKRGVEPELANRSHFRNHTSYS